VPHAFISYIFENKLNVEKLKASVLFVKGICEKMSFYDPNWSHMLSVSKHASSKRFQYVAKYCKDQLKDK
jgi:pyruvate formate-lyase activating enzyme-like uncharacterized protein